MKKFTSLKITNFLLVLSFIIQAFSGLSMRFLRSSLLYKIHGIAGPVFIALILIHIGLNYKWLVNNFLKKS
jgi:cytochrome b subunit of formate dehydrogenase